MPPPAPEQISETIETLYRSESGRVLATLVRLLGELDLAEEAMHEAFATALESWPNTGIPDSPRPWLIATARNKAIDVIRRRARFDGTQRDFALYTEANSNEARIRDKAIPYQVPASQELTARLGAVLQVIYLIFNEGYSAETTGAELSREAIRLGRLLLDLLQLHLMDEPEVMGLVGLMLLQESRRAARTSRDGDLILLDEQDRSLWNREQIAEGISLTESALQSRRFGAYTLQAAIAAVHAESSSPTSTDWREIKLLYDRLLAIHPSPVVELNRAVAIAMCEGPEQGLRLIDELLAREQLSNYHLAHSARADLCRRLGRIPEARASYEKALALISNSRDRHEPERR